jgi:hypothetical protein
MALPPWSGFRHRVTLHRRDDNGWAGIAEPGLSGRLVGSAPDVLVDAGTVTLTRRASAPDAEDVVAEADGQRSTVRSIRFDGGPALGTVLRDGDALWCWRDLAGAVGLRVTRDGAFVLGLGSLDATPGAGITIETDPRVNEAFDAQFVRGSRNSETRFVWLDPEKPREVRAALRRLRGGLPGIRTITYVVRTDSPEASHRLNRMTMINSRRPLIGSCFVTVATRFETLEAYLAFAQSPASHRPDDPWLRVRCEHTEACVLQQTTAEVGNFLVHVHRVHQPGFPGRSSQLGIVRLNAGVTADALERSVAAVAAGLIRGS